MFHRGSVFFAFVALMALSAPVAATQYDISTRADVIRADGFCSVREALLAINTRLGYIGDVPSDQRGVILNPELPNEPRLTMSKQVRNVSRGGSFVNAGSRLTANRGDVLEYRIRVDAEQDAGDVTGVSLAFRFPDEDAAVLDSVTGTWRGYMSSYIAGSTKLNGSDAGDVSGFPLALPLLINDAKIGDETIVPGTIREGRSAEIVFRVRVAEGPDEAVSADLPEEDTGAEGREYLVEAECPAGNSSNIISLKSVTLESGDDPVEYLLADGALEVGGVGANVSVRFEPMRDDAFDKVAKQNVIIIAEPGKRVFEVGANAALTLAGITLKGNGALPAGQNGGLIFSSGKLDLRGGTLLRDGLADQGGAVFIDGSGDLVLEQTRFENNEATDGNGGAIATAPSFRGGISGDRFYFEGNNASANGGAVYFGGLAQIVALQNGTFYGNSAQDGAAVRIAATAGNSAMNNVTIAGNTAAAPGGVALSYRAVTASSGLFDLLVNSVLVGNAGGDCAADDRPLVDGPPAAGSDLTLDLAGIAYVVSAGATQDAPSCGPLDAQFVASGGETFDYSLVDFGLLTGRDGSGNAEACIAGVGSAACLPQDFEDRLKGFLPNNSPKYSGAPAAGRIEPLVVSAGSPEDAVSYACLDKDQRGLNREPRCDAGAVELQIAAGTNDEFRIVQGEAVLLDVLANDLGDLTIDCGLLTDPLGCIGFFLPPRQSESVPVNWISGVTSAANPAPARTQVVVVEGRDGVYLNRDPIQKVAADGTPVVDENDLPVLEDVVTLPVGYPLVLHTSLPRFHGVDQFRYYVDRAAISGPVFAGANPSANANLVVEPASGLTNKGDISTLSGALGGSAMLLLTGLLLRFRRLSAALSAALLCVLSMGAQAADIVVNTNIDSAQPQDGVFDRDGLCSLREALLVSIDRSPFFFPDCTSGATGRDRIIIDVEDTIELEAPLDIFNSPVDIEGRGPGLTIIRPVVGNQHRIILASSSLTLKNLTIADGYSTANGGAIFTSANLTLDGVELRDSKAVGDGGAIYLNFNAEQKRQLTVRHSYMHGNTADGNGGLLSMVGQNQQHDLLFDSVTFANNAAPTGVGGALDVNLPRGGTLRVLNSTFVGNSADLGAALDFQQMDGSTTAYIINSTFVDNSAASPGAGAIEAGDSSGLIYLSNSIYIGSGGCNAGTVRFTESYFNLFAAPTPATCEAPVAADVGNMEAAEVDIRDVISDGVLVGQPFSDGAYIPPHLPVVAEARGNLIDYPAGVFVIDAGNNNLALVANDSSPRACRTLDLRGGSRASGGRCDVGAYELQVPTAIDDAVSNRTRSSRSIRFDVLFNDLAGDGVPGATGIVENTVLTGTIDLDPSTPGVMSENIVSVDLDEGDGEDIRDFRISKVTNGSWSINNTAQQLDEGVYELIAVLRDASDKFIASARQTVIVRDPADAGEDDEFVVVGSSALRISGISGDANGDFIVSDGRLVINGYTDADSGSDPDAVPVVELFINDISVGKADVVEGGAACGGEPGSAGEENNCIVHIEPKLPLSCEDVAEGGLTVVFPYSFRIFNSFSMETAESTAANITATIANVAPRFTGEVRRSVPGRVEAFRLVLEDPDLPVGQPLPLFDANPVPVERKSRLKLVTAPKFAKTVIRELNIDGPEVLELVYGIETYGVIDPKSEVYAPGTDGLGLLVREVGPGVIDVIYTPRNNDGRFNDRFVLGYEDECGATANAEFRILYPEADNLTGSVGWYGLIGVLVLFVRRRFRF